MIVSAALIIYYIDYTLNGIVKLNGIVDHIFGEVLPEVYCLLVFEKPTFSCLQSKPDPLIRDSLSTGL
jgi:hypothetical protein